MASRSSAQDPSSTSHDEVRRFGIHFGYAPSVTFRRDTGARTQARVTEPSRRRKLSESSTPPALTPAPAAPTLLRMDPQEIPTPNPPSDLPEASTKDAPQLTDLCWTLLLRERAEAEAEGRSWQPFPPLPSASSGTK